MPKTAEPERLRREIEAATAGSETAFEQLVRRYRGLVFAIVLVHLRDAAKTEEVVQEVFIALWRGLPLLRQPDRFLPWLRAVSRNLAVAHARREVRESGQVRELRMLLTRSAQGERRGDDLEELVKAVDRLPAQAREIVVLRYLHGYTSQDISRLLGVREPTVRKRLERSRASLRAELVSQETVALFSVGTWTGLGGFEWLPPRSARDVELVPAAVRWISRRESLLSSAAQASRALAGLKGTVAICATVLVSSAGVLWLGAQLPPTLASHDASVATRTSATSPVKRESAAPTIAPLAAVPAPPPSLTSLTSLPSPRARFSENSEAAPPPSSELTDVRLDPDFYRSLLDEVARQCQVGFVLEALDCSELPCLASGRAQRGYSAIDISLALDDCPPWRDAFVEHLETPWAEDRELGGTRHVVLRPWTAMTAPMHHRFYARLQRHYRRLGIELPDLPVAGPPSPEALRRMAEQARAMGMRRAAEGKPDSSPRHQAQRYMEPRPSRNSVPALRVLR